MEIEYTNEGTELTYNYKQFTALLKLFQGFIRRNSYQLNDKVIQFEENKGLELLEFKGKAIRELQYLLTIPNNGRETLISETKRDCEAISKEFDEIIENNQLLKQARGLDSKSEPKFPGEPIQDGEFPETNAYFQTLTDADKELFRAFVEVTGEFYEFYNEFLSLIGEKLAESVQKSYEPLIENLRNKLESYNPKQSHAVGLESNLTKPQLKALFERVKKDELIGPETTEEQFLAAFNPETLPQWFEPIRWIYKNGKRGAKKHLREFLELITGKGNAKEGRSYRKEKINPLFVYPDKTEIGGVTYSRKDYPGIELNDTRLHDFYDEAIKKHFEGLR